MDDVVREGEECKPIYDLGERTVRLAEWTIRFCKRLSRDVVSTPLISQLIRAGTSIGANFCEADEAISPKDFRHRISICKKEARETKYWLRLISTAEPDVAEQARSLWKETHEIHLILAAIYRKCKKP